jgi:uncharacterized protein YlxW (UPF0749 family)
MSDITDLENRMNQRIQDLSRELEEIKALLVSLSNEHTRRSDDQISKTELHNTEIRKTQEKLDRLQDSINTLSAKIQS